MRVADEIIAARTSGLVNCGFWSPSTTPTLPEMAREFGLRDDPSCYKEIDREFARDLIRQVLHRDMAYNMGATPEARAAELADLFLAQFGADARFYTNGSWHLPPTVLADGVVCDPDWNPVTDATFDTSVLVIGSDCSGCLWIEDED